MKKLLAFAFAAVLATTSAAYADDATDAKIQALQVQLDAVKAQLDDSRRRRPRRRRLGRIAPRRRGGSTRSPGTR